ncbi:APC family permease [Mucilaginibacter terrenus]|uniref:APC family permease n=1 Tax=Mucilaginibacter terrenus TaxID=2482727 RepID=A0A3E2NLM9_9SPHI|nr:APC family permease [Mucilaginibacter terrenus]RFZ81843.1 APC family permease [Mucilaginibacter terrenus]
MAMHQPAANRKIKPYQLVALIFFTVSGGPYGLEPLLAYAGEHSAVLLLLVVPLLWDVPAIFTVLELNSMMPVNGGYYRWVKYALGNRWGFYEGWWTWIYTFVDLAIYPVLFVGYASYFFPGIEEYRILVCLVIVWLSAGLNILGIVPVGKVALFLSAAVLAPLIVMFVMALAKYNGGINVPNQTIHGLTHSSFGMALYTIMWNCLGWDNVTTYADEVEKPIRSYLVSVFTAFALVMVIYFLVITVAINTGINQQLFSEGGFPALGELIAGRWLGAALAAGGMASSLGLYAAILLSVSRVPKAMADDELLPRRLNILHSRFRTPYVSILLCSVVVSFMILWPLAELLVIDVTVYGAGLSLEYISLIKLRISHPNTERPFKIRLGTTGLIIAAIIPFGIYFLALSGALASEGGGIIAALFAIIVLSTAEGMWLLVSWRKPHLRLKANS